MSIVILVRVGFLFISKHCYFSASLLNYWIESIAIDPSTVMFLTYAWKNVLKENISVDLIRDTMNAVFF